ncbi:hypothetical protein U27_00856 [Candidatus Vecturithrix granuli]|uniref:Uncharacterized protein n=1 Tax=Vecturithrix granuli TaxID=1499967 RepID=A0A081C8Q3_VECG1|nr:hypothetical protein U27_00856 [Candidatus Vecturithrix granuli]
MFRVPITYNLTTTQLGCKSFEDRYRITLKDFNEYYGRTLLNYYQDSPAIAVISCFPEYEWKEWLFDKTPQICWKNPDRHIQYMQWLGKQLGYKTLDDWYNITQKDFELHNGSGFLTHFYRSSPSAAVMKCFPENDWKEWLFASAPKNFWKSPDNRLRYMQWLGKQLNFRKYEDWYEITQKLFESHNGGGFLDYFHASPSAAVIATFPEYKWQPERFAYGKKQQKQLYRIIKKIFSKYVIKWDFKHPDMRFIETNQKMELDIFIPSLYLAFEYQGEQHVLPKTIWGGIPALKETQQRDEEKKNACRQHGITLIEVPHSWDGHEDTAIEMLTKLGLKRLEREAESQITRIPQMKA